MTAPLKEDFEVLHEFQRENPEYYHRDGEKVQGTQDLVYLKCWDIFMTRAEYLKIMRHRETQPWTK